MGRRCSLLLLAVALAACDRSSAVPPPVLTLLPAAFTGGTAADAARCLAPGDVAAAGVYVHEPSVTFTVRGTAAPGSTLAVAFGAETLAPQTAAAEAVELTYEAHPPAGLQTLRLSLAGGDSFCLTEVALRQP